MWKLWKLVPLCGTGRVCWVDYLFLADKAFRDSKEAEQQVTLIERADSILSKKAS